ncbi:MAG: hypothetical protein ABW071_09860 [Casimicrobiaceae bacterium]
MRKETVVRGERGRVVLLDTITSVDANDGGAIVVAASHGGTSSGEFALLYPLAAVFFNDAGVGKDDAGIAALAMLQARGVAAGAVSHQSCRIGDAEDMWKHGVISHANSAALALRLLPGMSLREALTRFAGA